MDSNRKIGNTFENVFCQQLFDKGFWVHNLTQNSAGQPADLIAVKNGKALLIDCKVCENNKFPLSRIEPNQHTAMDLWEHSGNGNGWFALQLNDGRVYMLDHHLMRAFAVGKAVINIDYICHYGLELNQWVEQW